MKIAELIAQLEAIGNGEMLTNATGVQVIDNVAILTLRDDSDDDGDSD
jgi:hypothetical protein